MELLKVEALRKYFGEQKLFGVQKNSLKAVDGVDFSIHENKVMALVGESGCGKSTVARLVLNLIMPNSGNVLFRGRNIFGFNRTEMKAFRKSVQIIFQDPFASLNPRRTIYDTLSEPLIIHKLVPRNLRRDAVVNVLGSVGLSTDILNRYPHEFSGGQRQRICIARALAVSPEMIVADEPLSALDVSIQAQILNLLQELKEKTKISFLFISHDLGVVKYFSDAIGVMYLGKIVEYAKTEELFQRPLHPYTEALLSCVPEVRVGEGEPRRRAVLKGDVPCPVNIPAGCPFHPRCPQRFEPCDKLVPLPAEQKGRIVSCHLRNPH